MMLPYAKIRQSEKNEEAKLEDVLVASELLTTYLGHGNDIVLRTKNVPIAFYYGVGKLQQPADETAVIIVKGQSLDFTRSGDIVNSDYVATDDGIVSGLQGYGEYRTHAYTFVDPNHIEGRVDIGTIFADSADIAYVESYDEDTDQSVLHAPLNDAHNGTMELELPESLERLTITVAARLRKQFDPGTVSRSNRETKGLTEDLEPLLRLYRA